MTPVIHQKASSCIRLITAVLFMWFLPFSTILRGEDSKSENPIKYYGDERIWFVPGWKAASQLVGGYEKTINDVYSEPVFVFRWDSNQNWNKSRDNSKKAAKDLVYKISLLPSEKQKDLILLGHSLGARVIANASKDLSDKNIKVKEVIFLGAAVDYDAEELNYVCNISIQPPINIFTQDDGVLKYAYGNTEKKVACGCFGINGTKGFKQYSFSIKETQEKADLKDELELHYFQNYCNILKRIEAKDSKLKSTEPGDLKELFKQIDEIIDETIIDPFPPKFLPGFNMLEENKGWQFARLGDTFAILDPLGRAVSYGTVENTLRKQWARIKEQLNKKDNK